MYANGEGVQEDAATARQWWEKSAENGFLLAQYMLGLLYCEGKKGVPRDYAKARAWFEKGARQGFPAAQVQLGTLYAEGKGGQKDIAAALEWFETACRQGNKEGCEHLKRLRPPR